MIMKAEKVKVIQQDRLEHLIEPNIYQRLTKHEYDLYKVDALSLLTHNRFSLSFKILFLQMLNKCYEYGEEVYLEHIRAFSFGSFIEPHSKDKIGKKKFLDEFMKIYEEIEKHGFNPQKSVLPLSTRNHIKNGTHRLAAAIFSNKDVYFIKTENKGPVFDYKYFYERNVRPEFMDAAAIAFAEFSKDTHFAIEIKDKLICDKEIKNAFSKLVYKKKITLNHNGLVNLNGLLGKVSTDNFSPKQLTSKSRFFRNDRTIVTYLFQANDNELTSIKQKLAEIYAGKPNQIIFLSNHEDVLNFSRIFFNDNALHYINYANNHDNATTVDKINNFKSILIDNGFDLNDFLVCADFLPEFYGLKSIENVPFISSINDVDWSKYHGIKNDSSCIEYYSLKKESLIYDPRNHFIFFGLKFVSFDNAIKYKVNRSFEVDLEDLKLLESIPRYKRKYAKFNRLKQMVLYRFHFIASKTEKYIGNLLRRVGIYGAINKYYTYIKSRLK